MTPTAFLDARWRADHPLPEPGVGQDKHQRGTMLVIGGSRFVPGALALTFEAAMRAGAGKVQLATVESVALALGVSLPEAGIAGLPENAEGNLDRSAVDRLVPLIERADCVVMGCGITSGGEEKWPVAELIGHLPECATAIIDAAALEAINDRPDLTRAIGPRLVMTPNHDECARLIGATRSEIDAEPDAAARHAASHFGATIVLKDRDTIICDGSALLTFVNEGTGLATAGSGDVLAGIAGGLLAQGIDPTIAAGWAVWLHAHAGQATARRIAPYGYLAREILIEIPSLLAEARRASRG